MKKIFMALVTLMTVSSVSAEVCTAKLDQIDRHRSYTVQRFVKYDYNQSRACNQAMSDCRREMSERRRYDRRGQYTCTVEGRGGQQDRNCTFELQQQNGRVIDVYTKLSCRAAEQACFRELLQRNRNGRNLRGRCVQSYSRPTPPPTRKVTKSCTVDRRGGQGRVKASHTAQATGRQGSGVKAKACQKAMRKCQNNVRNRQYCTQR